VSGDRRRRTRFGARIADCRARADALRPVHADDRGRLARRVDALFEALIDTIRCGPPEEARLLAPLADAMEDAVESLRALGGLTDPRVAAVLLRGVDLLEEVGRQGSRAADADTLRAALADAVSDTAWREHTRGCWIPPGAATAPRKPTSSPR